MTIFPIKSLWSKWWNPFDFLQLKTDYTPTGSEPVGTSYWDIARPVAITDTGKRTYAFTDEISWWGGGGSPVYFTTIDSDVTGYKKLSYEAEIAQTELTATIKNQELLLRTYLYDTGIDTTIIPWGTRVASYRAKVSWTQGNTQLKIEAFLRHTDWTETTLFSDYSDEINNLEYQTIKKETTQDSYMCLPTDRLGIRIYWKTTANNAITIKTIIGDGNATYFTTTLPQRHSQLRDLDFEHSGHTGFVGETFETVANNLLASDWVVVYSNWLPQTVTYANGIIKTITYTDWLPTTIVLSWATPSGIELTKTITYTDWLPTSFIYS